MLKVTHLARVKSDSLAMKRQRMFKLKIRVSCGAKLCRFRKPRSELYGMRRCLATVLSNLKPCR